jgi:hypothetical protein
MAATYPGTVISIFVSAADTLDHHQASGVDQLFFSFGDPLLQLKVGHDPVIFPIKVFGGFIFIRTDSDDRCSVFYLCEAPFQTSPLVEIPHITARLCDEVASVYTWIKGC